MQTDAGQRQGGFVQGVEFIPTTASCCGEADTGGVAGCCGEPVAGQAPDTAQGGCCGEPTASGENADGCCGEPTPDADQRTTDSGSCCD